MTRHTQYSLIRENRVDMHKKCMGRPLSMDEVKLHRIENYHTWQTRRSSNVHWKEGQEERLCKNN